MSFLPPSKFTNALNSIHATPMLRSLLCSNDWGADIMPTKHGVWGGQGKEIGVELGEGLVAKGQESWTPRRITWPQ